MNNLKRLSNEFYRIQCMNWIKNVGKGYMLGRYGAVPFIKNDFNLWEEK